MFTFIKIIIYSAYINTLHFLFKYKRILFISDLTHVFLFFCSYYNVYIRDTHLYECYRHFNNILDGNIRVCYISILYIKCMISRICPLKDIYMKFLGNLKRIPLQGYNNRCEENMDLFEVMLLCSINN